MIKYSGTITPEGNCQGTISQEAIEDLITLMNKN
jgi:hypothetical protein